MSEFSIYVIGFFTGMFIGVGAFLIGLAMGEKRGRRNSFVLDDDQKKRIMDKMVEEKIENGFISKKL